MEKNLAKMREVTGNLQKVRKSHEYIWKPFVLVYFNFKVQTLHSSENAVYRYLMSGLCH